MSALPVFTISDILHSEDFQVGRDAYQECRLHKTKGRRPRWYCKYAVDEKALGDDRQLIIKRVEKRQYFGYCSEMDKREASRLRDEFHKTVNTPRKEVVKSQVLLSEWIRKYQDLFIPTLKPNSQASYIAYSNAIAQKFGGFKMCDLKRESIQAWINEMSATRTRRTCTYYLAVFSSLMEVAADWGYSEGRNPCHKVRLPIGRRSTVELRALEPDEIRRLIAGAAACEVEGVNLGKIIEVAIFCGLRIGEILALEWGDIRDGRLCVSKSRSQATGETTGPKSAAGFRELPLGPVRLVRPINAKDSDRVFPVEYKPTWRAVRDLFAKVNIRLRGTAFHALRRTFCTYFDAAGAKSLREQMGHSSEWMSQHYVRRTYADAELSVNRMAEFILGDAGGVKQ